MFRPVLIHMTELPAPRPTPPLRQQDRQQKHPLYGR
jgi:hypothetical protein